MIQVRTPVATGIRSVSLAVSTRGSLVLALLFILSLPAVTPRLYASDEIEYFAYLRSLWFDRDLSFENEYRYFYDRGIARAFGFRETFLELTTETGRRPNFATIGCALLWAPFYALGDLVARTLAAAGWPVAVDGFSRPYLAAVTYGSALYGFLGVWLSVVAARRIVGQGHLAALLVWLGTPLLFYMYVAPGMSHANSAFAVAAFVVAWLRIRERWSIRGLAGLGALAALMGMVREQDLFFCGRPGGGFRLDPRPAAQGRGVERPVAATASGERLGRGRDLRRCLPPAGRCLHHPQRTARAVSGGGSEDGLDDAARAPGAGLGGARLFPLDTAGALGDRRARDPGYREGGSRSTARGHSEDRHPAAPHAGGSGVRLRQRGFLVGGRHVRAATICGLDGSSRHRSRRALSSIQDVLVATVDRRGDRPLHLVERRPHGAVWQRDDGSAETGVVSKRLRHLCGRAA